MTSPEAGEWLAEITGKGRYWLEAQVQSDIYFVGVEFVKEGGRPGHEGLFRIHGQPVVGTPATLQASLSASATKTTEFYLVTERGETISEAATCTRLIPTGNFLNSSEAVDLPNVPFRVAMMGLDSNGKQYQRFFSNLFHAESVEAFCKAGL